MSKIIFQDSFLSFGIMCRGKCGTTIENGLYQCVQNYCNQIVKDPTKRPANLKIIKDAEPIPNGFGIHSLFINITCDEPFCLNEQQKKELKEEIRNTLNFIGFGDEEIQEQQKKTESARFNWINIGVNLMALVTILCLTLIFPPSLFLTIGLAAISFLTTAFTARQYLREFINNLRQKNFATMSTTISLGWLLSLTHALYHSISMPLASFSMAFMSFGMPVLLMTFINAMDEIKRRVFSHSKTMQLASIKSLFPGMAKEYLCYQLDDIEQNLLKTIYLQTTENAQVIEQSIQQLLADKKLIAQSKNAISDGMILQINKGECIPVDSILIQGHTLVDSSLLTGEPQQSKKCLDSIPAGAINLGSPIIVYATKDGYNSSINNILFSANRPKDPPVELTDWFRYFYLVLIVLSIAAAIAIPCFAGVFTIPLLLQSLTGILFAVCPCTIALAYQLPQLFNVYQRNKKGIRIRNEQLCKQFNPPHTVIFDKTGTLTTGNSVVDSSEGISLPVWERIYLLEKNFGGEHPIAKAIIKFYDSKTREESAIKDIKEVTIDAKNRGLAAFVQGKKIHIGNAQFLEESGIVLSELDTTKISQGFSVSYVAEGGKYQGAIYIKHEIREGIKPLLERLKKDKVQLIMLTGDNKLSALGFNQQNGSLFDKIKADRSPEHKQQYIEKLMKKIPPRGLWYIGDGINDTPSLALLSKEGGVGCAMTSEDKSTFFADISLNGSLDYLFVHNKLNRFFIKITRQNKALLVYSLLFFLAFIITFSVLGISLNPIVPLVIMTSTTFFVIFNSYRMQWAVDNALDKSTSWLKKILASDLSFALIIGISSMLLCGLLIAAVASGGLAIPVISFSAGVLIALSSSCFIAAIVQACVAVILAGSSFIADKVSSNEEIQQIPPTQLPFEINKGSSLSVMPAKKVLEINSYVREEPCEENPAVNYSYP